MLVLCLSLLCFQATYGTDRPIIGVLSQWYGDGYFPNLEEADNHTSFLSASYVKWIEAAGARVVPVIISVHDDDLTEYFREVFAGINGLVIPGGHTSIRHSGYADASHAFFKMAKEANDAGDVFPIWGTCLGFEMLGQITNNGQDYLKRCNSYEQSLPLELEPNWLESRLFGSAPEEVIDHLTQLPVTSNFHHWCLTRENFTKFEMGNFWKPLSVNSDLDGLEFISSMESKDYPFYATQFHPEKNIAGWSVVHPSLPHSREATLVSLYFTQFFVDIARQSKHAFPSRKVEESHLIYNYPAYFVGQEKTNSGYTQVYLF